MGVHCIVNYQRSICVRTTMLEYIQTMGGFRMRMVDMLVDVFVLLVLIGIATIMVVRVIQ
jgi:hypothetical protein